MPNVHEQFQPDFNFMVQYIKDVEEALFLLRKDMRAIAGGAVRPHEARQFALESLNAIFIGWVFDTGIT